MSNNIEINNLYPRDSQSDAEISLLDIVNFLIDIWKKLAIAAFIGAILGFAFWNFFGKYEAEYSLNNRSIEKNQINQFTGLDLITWKAIQKKLPALMAQIKNQSEVPEGQAGSYTDLASEWWWQKNVIPKYALYKTDMKDLTLSNKDTDLALSTILSLTIKADGSSKENAIENAKAAATFLCTGGAYVQVRDILNALEIDTHITLINLKKNITTVEIEMGYQVWRAKVLEDLQKRFPGGNNTSNQVFDLKDSASKYLPLTTQIIAVNDDINQSKEKLQRLRDRINQIALTKTFLEEASPLAEKIFDGILLIDSLLAIETKLRAKLPKEDLNQQVVLDQLRSQLLSIKTLFTINLSANAAPTVSKTSVIKSMAGGLAGAFFLMLLVLLGQRVWVSIKSGGAK